MSVIVERPLGRDQGRDLDIYQIFGRIQGKSVARSRHDKKLGIEPFLRDICGLRYLKNTSEHLVDH